MHPRLFRLIEAHQRIDERLRLAQQRPVAALADVVHLKVLKTRAKRLIERFTMRTARA